MNAPTLRQLAVLDFVRLQIGAGLPVPTHREIQQHFGMGSPRSATEALLGLEKKGLIERPLRQKRSITITEAGNHAAAA